jgi:hypothetical protein
MIRPLLIFFLLLTSLAQAGEMFLYYRNATGDWEKRVITTIPGYILSFDGLGQPELAPMPSGGGGGSGSGDVVGPASSTSSHVAVFNGTTGKLLMGGGYTVAGMLARSAHTGTQDASTITGVLADARIPTTIPRLADANIFTARQRIDTNAVFPAFISNFTGGRAASLWNGGTASVLSFDSAGQLLVQSAANSDINGGTGAGTYVGMIKGDGKMGVGFSSASHVLDFIFEGNGVVAGSQLAVEGDADAFEGFFRNLGTFTADRFYDVPNRSGTMAIEDNTSAVNLLNSISNNQGDILYRNNSGWVALAPGTSGQFLRTNGAAANPSWSTPAGSGDVVGPASSVNDQIAAFDGTTGKLIKDTGVTMATLRNASNAFTSGTVPSARLGSGTADGTTYLRGDGTWATPSGGGSVATDTIYDAKGDLPVGTGSNTAARLAVGANGKTLIADSAESTGVRWGDSADSIDYDKWHIGTYTFHSNTTIVATNFSTASASGTATADNDGTATRLKNISYASAATTNSDAGFTSNVAIGHVQQDWDVKWTGGLDTLTDVRYIGGHGEGFSAIVTTDLPGVSAAAWFRYSTSAGDTTWKCLSDDDAAGNATVTDSGVTVTTGQVRFRITKTATAVTFYINGTQVAQHTTTASIPDKDNGASFMHRARTLANAAATCYFSQAEIRHRIP